MSFHFELVASNVIVTSKMLYRYISNDLLYLQIRRVYFIYTIRSPLLDSAPVFDLAICFRTK